MVCVVCVCANSSVIPTHTDPSLRGAMNMSSFRKYGRYSMNLTMEQERLQGWLSVANAVDSGKAEGCWTAFYLLARGVFARSVVGVSAVD